MNEDLVESPVRKRATVSAAITTTNAIALANIAVIERFFASYQVDKAGFYALWVDDEPAVITPFVTGDVAVCTSVTRVGWPDVRSFWDPIHDEMSGKFDWTIEDIIVGEDPNKIVTKSTSDIDVVTGPTFGGKHIAYQGRYVQIFTFVDNRIKSFEEYYDTALLNRIYGG